MMTRFLSFLVLTLVVPSTLAAPVALITLDPTLTYQTITGWEATAYAGELLELENVTNQVNANPAFALYGPLLFDQAVNDLGINRVRLEIGCGAENTTDYFTQYLNGQIAFLDGLSEYNPVNDDDDPFSVDTYINNNPASADIPGFVFSALDYKIDQIVTPLQTLVTARGESLFVNVCYTAFSRFPFLQYRDPEEYAEFVLATYQHIYQKYGWVPDSWEVMLEPDNTAFNGTLIGQAIQAASARLQSHGFTPHFVAPSVTNMNNFCPYYNALKAVLGDSGVSQDLMELSYHRYGTNDSLLPAIAMEAANHGIHTAMLEHIGSGYRDLHKDLKQGNNSAWSRFILGDYYPENGGKYYNIDQRDPSNPVVSMSSDTKLLRQYFKFIRAGAVRIEAQTSDNGFDPVAFLNADSNPVMPGKWVVVVSAARGGPFSIAGLPAGVYGCKHTTASEYDIDLPDQTIDSDGVLSTAIPAGGVLTVYGK